MMRKEIALLAFAACLVLMPAALLAQDKTLRCKAPGFLRKGDKVALISPAYYLPPASVEQTASILRDWGFEPVTGPNVGKVISIRYAGTREERISDIIWALRNPEIKAIICNRGGYGTFQMIDSLSRCRGVVLGSFKDCEDEFNYGSVEAMLMKYLKPLGIPVLCGFPAGHGKVNLPLVLGAPVSMEVNGEESVLRFDIEGTEQFDLAVKGN